jgi:recombination associated protein RdgC
MWFKNIYLYRLENDFTLSPEELHDALLKKAFTPCAATQRESLGWVSPLGKNSEMLTHAANGYILLTMARQERLLPASVIREEMEEKVAEIEAKEDRKVSRKEKKEMRENLEFELLPRAFTRTQKIDAWISPRHQGAGWLVVNTPSAPRAEALSELLRKTLGSLPLALPETEVVPTVAMSKWLKDGVLPVPFELALECELKSEGDEKSVVAFRKHELLTDEVQANLDAGKVVSRLGMVWDNKISFLLTEDLQIRKLRFLDVLEEQLQDSDPQTHEEHLDIEFALMTGEVSAMLGDLFKALNLESPVEQHIE